MKRIRHLLRLAVVALNLLLFLQICILMVKIWDLPSFLSGLTDLPREMHGDLHDLPVFGELEKRAVYCCLLAMATFCISVIQNVRKSHDGMVGAGAEGIESSQFRDAEGKE